MSKYLLYILAFVFPLNIFAISPIETDSVKLWNYEGTTALNVSQVSFTHWAAGGQSSISATGLVKFTFSYKDSCNVWDNSIDMAYGVIRQGDVGSLAKSDDRIELNSSYLISFLDILDFTFFFIISKFQIQSFYFLK